MDKLPIPYSFSDMSGVQHPAVSTRSSVFFAVNPSLAMFKGFARGCLTEGYEWSLQLSALSSYAPIKIWRIDPFAYCPYGSDGTERCVAAWGLRACMHVSCRVGQKVQACLALLHFNKKCAIPDDMLIHLNLSAGAE